MRKGSSVAEVHSLEVDLALPIIIGLSRKKKEMALTRPRIVHTYVNHFCVLSAFILCGLSAAILVLFYPVSTVQESEKFVVKNLETAPERRITKETVQAAVRDETCDYYTCFDVYKCGQQNSTVSVYIYPIYRYEDENGVPVSVPQSEEFLEILETVYKSRYYTPDPSKACFFVPSLDLLNQNKLRLQETSQVLASLPYWEDGQNHILFNMLPGSAPDYNSVLEVNMGQAILAGASLSEWTYRRGLDISIPLYSHFSREGKRKISVKKARKWLVVSSQTNIHQEYVLELELLAEEHQELLILNKCSNDQFNVTVRCKGSRVYAYPQILADATFCLMIRGARLGQLALTEAMMMGCIPVVVADTYVLPFADVLDWKRAAVIVYEDNIFDLMNILKSFSDQRILDMRRHTLFFYDRYFASVEKITNTVLDVLNDRVYRHLAKSYTQWNDIPSESVTLPPLFLPVIAQKSQGFTAVILTYDRVESLFKVIQRVVQAPSLAKVLVVWNNQKKAPPPASMWPKINKLLKVVQTRENKLSNRFYPYDEIETEAVLAIDDDIVMLTADELEFGFEVWREFPDRIVGFPSRVHLWDNGTSRWKYESEWTNEISMVLTGAAFYHKYYNYLYTTSMPGDIKTWVDERMNCEDIAMNFLVANITGKGPIKVTPRKKFRCPECTNMEMLSLDVAHMAERNECINRFTKVYGTMPLKSVEFRADPVLFKDNFPEKLKRFNNIGSV